MNLLDKCEFERTRARELGLKLEIAHADLKNITKADGFCLIDEVINTWYKSSVEGPTWEKLITAVDECGDKRAAESLRELVMHQGEKGVKIHNTVNQILTFTRRVEKRFATGSK